MFKIFDEIVENIVGVIFLVLGIIFLIFDGSLYNLVGLTLVSFGLGIIVGYEIRKGERIT